MLFDNTLLKEGKSEQKYLKIYYLLWLKSSKDDNVSIKSSIKQLKAVRNSPNQCSMNIDENKNYRI